MADVGMQKSPVVPIEQLAHAGLQHIGRETAVAAPVQPMHSDVFHQQVIRRNLGYLTCGEADDQIARARFAGSQRGGRSLYSRSENSPSSSRSLGIFAD